MAFPDTPLDVVVEAAFGADVSAAPSTWVWTDIGNSIVAPDSRTRLMNTEIQVKRGRAEETSTAQPASLTLDFENSDGALTPGNPASLWYPNVRRGTPLRLRVNDPALAAQTTSYLQLSARQAPSLSTPDHASLDITGDIEIVVDAELPKSYSPMAMLGKYTGLGQLSWSFRLVTPTQLQFFWAVNGTSPLVFQNSNEAPFSFFGRRTAFKVTVDVDNGAGQHVVSFFVADTAAGPFTSIGSFTRAGTTSFFSSTSPVEAGRRYTSTPPFDAKYRKIEIRNGIAGTLVASPDFTTLTESATSITDAQGRVWTWGANSRVITENPQVRFIGQISEIAPQWPSGDLSTDVDAGNSIVSITASGVLRRMQQGAPVIDSALRKAIPASSPVGYWPLEDDADSTVAASGLQNGNPATTVGADFASDDTLPGSDPLLKLGPAPDRLAAPVPVSATNQFTVAFLYNAPSAPGPNPGVRVASIYTNSPTHPRWDLLLSDTVASLEGFSPSGALIYAQDMLVGSDLYTGWQWWSFYATQNGGSMTWSFEWNNIGGKAGYFTSTVPTTTVGNVSQVVLAPDGLNEWSFGHLIVFDKFVDADAFPADGYKNETAGIRASRLASEAGVDMIAETVGTAAMGPQDSSSHLQQIFVAATAEQGVVSEQIRRFGLAFRPNGSLYNQTPVMVLDASRNEITFPFQPIEDDQRLRNDITVDRDGGSSFRAADVDPQIGVYDESLSTNLANDTQLVDLAYWRLWTGTWPGMRYPTVTVDFLHAGRWLSSFFNLKEGDRIQVINLPPQHPLDTVDLIVEGWLEKLAPESYKVELSCSPAGIWNVGHLTTDTNTLGYGRLSAATTLQSAVTSTATSFVTVSSEPWTTTAGDFPFDVVVNGERMTVTNITGSASPQTFTVVRSVNGVIRSHSAGSELDVYDPLVMALE